MSITIIDEPITAQRQIKAINAAHPIVEDITKSPSKFFLPSFIRQRYNNYIINQNKSKIKKPNRSSWVFLLEVKIGLFKIAVLKPSILNPDHSKSAYLKLSTPCCVCDTPDVEDIRPCGWQVCKPTTSTKCCSKFYPH